MALIHELAFFGSRSSTRQASTATAVSKLDAILARLYVCLHLRRKDFKAEASELHLAVSRSGELLDALGR
eukprot:6183523-Pleurochrysis_carterae.AAC.1